MSPNLTGRALAAKQEQDARSAELRASWLARSRADAVRRWESTLGPTRPEDWRPCAPDTFERDHLRITVEGFVFTQEHGYNGGHRWWLVLRGAPSAPIHSEYDLHRAFAVMRPWSLLAARVRGALSGASDSCASVSPEQTPAPAADSAHRGAYRADDQRTVEAQICASPHHKAPVLTDNGTDRCDTCWYEAQAEMESQR